MRRKSSGAKKKRSERRVVETNFCPWQHEALTTKAIHYALIGGIAVGKSFTGAHFAIQNFLEHPELTGFIGANSYDQLSQATLRELMYWLDEYGIPYVIDRKPPDDWKAPRRFKDYSNIISVKVGNIVAYAFTRVLSDGDALRGLEFSWYWIDETRDTPQNTHDIILSRLRESDYVKGLVTTTPIGEDWSWKRFVQGADNKLYACSHTPTIEAVHYGIITQAFYDALRASYSPAMAAQELEAKHVIVMTGRCYYTYDEETKQRGLWEPDPDLPLIVGMDFNFSPAPMVWEVGQMNAEGTAIHWFAELSDIEISSREMARRLGNQFGNFFLRIFGDASGTRGTTSNAGVTDFNQIADELSLLNVEFTLDTDQMNPLVRDRVENVCRVIKDANGTRSMTVDPDRCPHLNADLERVCWKNGKPSDGGDCQRTHGADGAGYALWKVMPPNVGHAKIGKGISSMASRMGE